MASLSQVTALACPPGCRCSLWSTLGSVSTGLTDSFRDTHSYWPLLLWPRKWGSAGNSSTFQVDFSLFTCSEPVSSPVFSLLYLFNRNSLKCLIFVESTLARFPVPLSFYFDIPLMISVAQSETAALAPLSSSWVLSIFALFHLSFPYFSHSDFPPPLPPVHQTLSWPNKH